MSRREIIRKFDEIVSFAEVERFLDTPLKHYSTGMQMRLAFAVAAHLEPEILLVDEVLAVGDAAFQKRCLAKMGEVSRQGRTIVFVSHNMTAVERLCHKVFCLDQGKIVASGMPKEMIRKYLNAVSTVSSEREWQDINSAAAMRGEVTQRASATPGRKSGRSDHGTYAVRHGNRVLELKTSSAD